MKLKDIASCLVEPGYQDDLAARRDTVKAFGKSGSNFHPCIWGTFVTLFGAIFPPLQLRAHETNRLKQIWVNGIEVYHGDYTLRLF
jgi:hypothetical protein